MGGLIWTGGWISELRGWVDVSIDLDESVGGWMDE